MLPNLLGFNMAAIEREKHSMAAGNANVAVATSLVSVKRVDDFQRFACRTPACATDLNFPE